MLLRIVAAAGTGILLGASACSSTGAEGLVANSPEDASKQDESAPPIIMGMPTGSVACPGICGTPFEEGGPTGVIDGSSADASSEAGNPADAGDAALTCGNGGVCGSLVMPPDAGHDADSDASTDAGVFFGIVHGVVPNPGH